MRKLVLLAGAGMLELAFANQGFGATLSLYSVTDGSLGPQSSSNPCIIAATHCSQPAGFGYTDFTQKGSIPSYDETSPDYTVSQLPTTFDVAIDVNTTSDAGETLDLFEVLVNGNVVYDYTGPTLIGGISNNGNGYGDWGLTLIDLSAFGADDVVSFHAVWSGASDGGESFFIVNGETTEVPVPGTLGLLGIGLVALGSMRRRVNV